MILCSFIDKSAWFDEQCACHVPRVALWRAMRRCARHFR
jgi:hypothetical protein